jgi:hypothetical protein
MSPEASLRIWMPAIHAGMTNAGFSSFVGERKIMNHFLVVRRGKNGESPLSTVKISELQ